MARIDVVMPQMGESIAEGTIVKWHKKVGDFVKKDETLLEISTDKVDSEIPSPASGVLADIMVQENETVAVRAVIAHLETETAQEPKAAPGPPPAAPLAEQKTPAPAVPAQPVPPVSALKPALSEAGGRVEAPPSGALRNPERGRQAESKGDPERALPSEPKGERLPRVEGEPNPAPQETVAGPAAAPFEGDRPAERPLAPVDGGKSKFFSPVVMNIARTEGVPIDELERVPGTGEGGRVTKKDLLAFLEIRKSTPRPPAPPEEPRPAIPQAGKPVDDAALRQKYPAPGHEVLQMSNVLQRMAQHMVQSVQTSPHVAAVHEVDMTAIAKHRTRHAEAFERREGFKLTYTPYLVDAVVKALKKFSLVNSSVEGDRIIKKNFINLGIAVASEHGLIVPVIKHAEEKNFLGYARAVNDLATRTRTKKLTPEEIQGGTFTITNYGVFGTLFGTPIINQPQVAILGTGAIRPRVVVIDDAIAIRSMAFFTLSFDHRIIDGATGGMFMNELVTLLEKFDTSIGI